MKITTAEISSGPTTSVNEVSSTQQAIRRSPNIIDSGAQRFPNKVQTDRPRTRIPSTWITSSTTTTTRRSTSTRAPLRTSHPTVRSPTVRAPQATSRPVSRRMRPVWILCLYRLCHFETFKFIAHWWFNLFSFLFHSFSRNLSQHFWLTIFSLRVPTVQSHGPSIKLSTRPSRLWTASLECFALRWKLSLGRDNWLTSREQQMSVVWFIKVLIKNVSWLMD